MLQNALAASRVRSRVTRLYSTQIGLIYCSRAPNTSLFECGVLLVYWLLWVFAGRNIERYRNMLVNRLPFVVRFWMAQANGTRDGLGRFIGFEAQVKLLFAVSLFAIPQT